MIHIHLLVSPIGARKNSGLAASVNSVKSDSPRPATRIHRRGNELAVSLREFLPSEYQGLEQWEREAVLVQVRSQLDKPRGVGAYGRNSESLAGRDDAVVRCLNSEWNLRNSALDERMLKDLHGTVEVAGGHEVDRHTPIEDAPGAKFVPQQ